MASLPAPELLAAGTTITRELVGLARPTYDAWLADYQWQTEQLRRGATLDQASQALQAQSAKVLAQAQQDLAIERSSSTQAAATLHTTQQRLQVALAQARPPLLFDPRLYAGTAAGLVAGLVLAVVLSHP